RPQIGVHFTGAVLRLRRRGGRTGVLIFPVAFGGGAEGSLLARLFLANRFAVRRGVLDFGVQLGADQNRQRRDVEPRQQDDDAANRAVGRVIGTEVRDVELEAE